MDNRTKWITFLTIVCVGGVLGYVFGAGRHKSELFASVGVALGFVVCLGIWLILRREHYRDPLHNENKNIE